MRYVKYVGLAHQRQITAQDWRSVGVSGDTVVWSAYNGFAVPLDQFSDDQIRKAIDPDPKLVITGGDEEFEPVHHGSAMTPAQAAQASEAPLDVPAYLDGRENVSTAISEPSGGAPTVRDTPDPDDNDR